MGAFKVGAWTPQVVFVIDLSYLAALTAIPVFYRLNWLWVRSVLSEEFGILPVWVPWFGAVGAVLISLSGVFSHNKWWDYSWNYWHFARPFVGAILAVVACLTLVGLLSATGFTDIDKRTFRDASNAAPFLVISFIVGFREEAFRTLIQRAADSFLGSAPSRLGDVAVYVINAEEKRNLVVGRVHRFTVIIRNDTTKQHKFLWLEGGTKDGVEVCQPIDNDEMAIEPNSALARRCGILPTKAGEYDIDFVVTGSFGSFIAKARCVVHDNCDEPAEIDPSCRTRETPGPEPCLPPTRSTKADPARRLRSKLADKWRTLASSRGCCRGHG